ncbi:oxidoreductase [Microbacterium paludicola]|uniref:Oxidoreductase n=1 Tax=Microbacterium paludicola TaxID=300019 RepID=A0A4Y9FYQ1_9MICO|nr:phosphoglycerate dehydrogenase [Microbacterium paludicola]TFU33440.1 oxidoreductase [Microbacterium paludicola]
MGRGRILITPRSLTRQGLIAEGPLDLLRQAGYELVGCTPGEIPAEAELRRVLPGCVGWLAGVEPITARVLDAADALRVISRNGAGVDGIDHDAAAERGVRVVRAAGANAQGVAELAIGLAIDGLRGITWSARALADGQWRRREGRELGDVTIGVVGLGAIGRRVATMAAALGADVVAHDPFVAEAPFDLVPLDDLIARADVVTLHIPPSPQGRPVIDGARLARMRRGAVLINTSRSALVDDDAVLAALESDQLAAYAVDAYDTEPPAPSRLLAHPATIATSHLGAYTDASVRRAAADAVRNLITALEKEA